MKIYRALLWCLLVVFVAAIIIYIAYFYNEQSSSKEGTLIWRKEHAADYDLC